MQKLKNRVVDRMLTAHLTKSEVDFMLELAHYQDDNGRVYGVYYRKICEAIDISFETFYVTINSLEQKGLIYKEKAAYGDFDITINDNDMSYPGAMQEGFIDLKKHKMFWNDQFKQLKAGEKLLAMHIFKIVGANSKYSISVENFLEKYAQLLQVTERTIKAYLTRIKRFFSVEKNHGVLFFRIGKHTPEPGSLPTDLDMLSRHLIYVGCRRNRIADASKHILAETRRIVSQFHCRFPKDIAKLFLRAVKLSIEKLNSKIPNKYRWVRELKPALVCKFLLG